jgi:hypothetical protein
MGLAAIGLLNPLFTAFSHIFFEPAFILNPVMLLPVASR